MRHQEKAQVTASAGGKYGALVKSARILDAEKYNLSVVD